MPDKLGKAISEMTPIELIAEFGSLVSWAVQGVGMLRSAYVLWRIQWERAKHRFQEAKATQQALHADMCDRCTDYFVVSYKLLAALAMENLAKGLVIAKNKLVISDSKLPRWFLTHDIVSLLCQKGGFQLNKQERMVLADSSKAIIWQTRYPIPKSSACLPEQWPGTEFGVVLSHHPVHFRDLATRMLHDYPEEGLRASFFSTSDLIQILKLECPDIEPLLDS